MAPPLTTSVEMIMADGVFVKTMGIPKAYTLVPQHSHTYDHTSVVAKGSVRLIENGQLIGDYHAPKALLIRANHKHLFISLEDDTLILCIHNVSRSGVVEIESEHTL